MMGWSMGTEAWIWMAVWAVVMILVVWLLVREPRRESHDDPASAILRDRFARGQISEEEYRRATAALDDPSITAGGGVRSHAIHHAHGQETRHD